jgi:hypothetical protein
LRDASDASALVATTAEILRDASAEFVREGFHCPSCNRDIVTAVVGLFRNPKSGSPQRFCSPSCRQAAYRRRKAGVPETTPGQFNGGRNRRLNAAEEVTPVVK